MANPQYIEYLNTFGADIDITPQTLEKLEPLEKRNKTQFEEQTAEKLFLITTARIDDLPFKIKIKESEFKEPEKAEKFKTL